jgi:PAS domain S-box-containing protein
MTEDRVMSNTGELQQVSSGSHGSGRLFDDQYQSVFRAAPIGIGLTRNRILLQVNERLCQMTGYHREELVGQSARILYPDTAEFERVGTVKYDQIQRFGTGTIETRWQRKDGAVIDVLLSSTPLKDSDPKSGVTFTALDISDRKQSEAKLRASEEKYRLLAENTVDAIWLMDLDLTFRYINPSVYFMLGFTEAEWIGSKLTDHFPAVEIEYMNSLIEKELVQGVASRGVVFETRIYNKAGELVPVEISGKFLYDEKGNPVGLQGTTRDIRARKQAEAEIRRLNENLERRVVERTAQLDAVNKELEAFAYSVSHDLRAPLRSIDGFSRALLEDYSACLDEPGKDYLLRVRAATLRMGQLIEDMLKLSRTMRHEMIRQPVDLSALAHSVIEELREQEPQRSVATVIAPEVQVAGDPHLLRVALTNLFGNAWKFTAKQPDARIEFGRVAGQVPIVCFVRDNGAGFDMAYADKLFKAFQRLHTSSEFKGSGIGLATVKRIVERHGGRVWAEGQVGKGAVFYFTLEAKEGSNG